MSPPSCTSASLSICIHSRAGMHACAGSPAAASFWPFSAAAVEVILLPLQTLAALFLVFFLSHKAEIGLPSPENHMRTAAHYSLYSMLTAVGGGGRGRGVLELSVKGVILKKQNKNNVPPHTRIHPNVLSLLLQIPGL